MQATRTKRVGARVAVITGASQGIGRAIALAFAEAGAGAVAGFHLPDPKAEHVRAEVERRGATALFCEGDVRDSAGVEAFAAEVERTFGGIDVWINNAGVVYVGDVSEMPDAEWERVLATNLTGCFYGCRAALRRMLSAGTGNIVNLSSVTANQPPARMAAYVATKAGIAGLTRSLAVEVGPRGVRVNAVAPGAVQTEMTRESFAGPIGSGYRRRVPMRRVSDPEEIAAAVLFLASPAASYVNGHELIVDGALHLNGSVDPIEPWA